MPMQERREHANQGVRIPRRFLPRRARLPRMPRIIPYFHGFRPPSHLQSSARRYPDIYIRPPPFPPPARYVARIGKIHPALYPRGWRDALCRYESAALQECSADLRDR